MAKVRQIKGSQEVGSRGGAEGINTGVEWIAKEVRSIETRASDLVGTRSRANLDRDVRW